jgi:uncharacterized DUF497 family protein
MDSYMFDGSIRVEWDPNHAATNLREHNVDFADAVGLFHNTNALTQEDPRADGALQFVTVGRDFLGRVLTIVFAYHGDRIRLLSARLVTRREHRAYERRQ